MRKIVLALCLALSAQANDAGNGGTLVAAKFVGKSWEILRHLEHVQTDLLTEKQRIDFQLAIFETGVVAVKGPIYDIEGKEVDARVITDSQGKSLIELDMEKWEKLMLDPDVNKLIMHEYCRIIKLETGKHDYTYSSRLNMGPPGAPFLPNAIYTQNGGHFGVRSNGQIYSPQNTKWPFTFWIPDFTQESAYNFVLYFPQRLRYNAEQGYWETTAEARSSRCRLPANVIIRLYDDGKTMELTIAHPTRIYNECQSYGTHKILLNAKQVKL